MKKGIITIIISVIVLAVLVSSFVVFASSEKQEETMENKVAEEISYLDNSLISLLSDFNNNPDWNGIQTKMETLYQTWNTISIDLNFISVDKKIILSFNDALNSTTQNVKKKDTIKSIETAVNMYNLLPQYSQSFSPNSKETNVLKVKSNIVSSYVGMVKDNWQEAKNQLSEANNQFTNLINSVNQNFQNQNTVNQCYVLINELIRTTSLKDKDIFYIQYKNLMEKMEII